MDINYFMYLVGFTLMMILNLVCYPVYRCSKKRAVIYTLMTYVFGVLSAMLMGKIYTMLAQMRHVEDVSKVAIFGAVIFTPLLILLSVAIENLIFKKKQGDKFKPANQKDTMDLLTPGIFIILTCAKFGCFCGGCCYGVACDFGVFNPKAGTKVFPVQIFEVITMCAVLLLSFFLKRHSFYRRGMAYPLTAALYTVGRFGWEYLRYYPEGMRPFAFGMTVWQITCLFVFAVSVMSLIAILVKNPADPLVYIRKKKPVIR